MTSKNSNFNYALKLPVRVYDDVSYVVIGDKLEQVETDKVDYVLLDLETDLCGEKGQIIQVIATRLRGGKAIEKFNSYIYPGYVLSDEIVEATSCSNLYFDKTKDRKETMENLRDFIGDSVLLAGPYEYCAYIRELKKFSIDNSCRAWINIEVAVDRIIYDGYSHYVERTYEELKNHEYSIGYNHEKYINLCVTIMELFTINQLNTLAKVNEYYSKIKLDIYSRNYFSNEFYIVVDNMEAIKFLVNYAAKKNYDLNDEYAGDLEIMASELRSMSEYVNFALHGGDNRYYRQSILCGKYDSFAEEMFKCASVIRVGLIDAIIDRYKNETIIDADMLRDAYIRELKAAKESGYIEVPAKIFDDIKQTSMHELYKIYKLL